MLALSTITSFHPPVGESSLIALEDVWQRPCAVPSGHEHRQHLKDRIQRFGKELGLWLVSAPHHDLPQVYGPVRHCPRRVSAVTVCRRSAGSPRPPIEPELGAVRAEQRVQPFGDQTIAGRVRMVVVLGNPERIAAPTIEDVRRVEHDEAGVGGKAGDALARERTSGSSSSVTFSK